MVIKEAFRKARDILKKAGIESADFEIKCLLRDIFGVSPNSQEEFKEAEKLFALAHRRAEGYPLQYLIGNWDFYDITLIVGEGVLIPRGDTEVLVDLSLDFLKERENIRVLDLCSGTGAIPLAISNKVKGEYFAVEKEEKAFYYLEKNNEKYSSPLKLCKADVLDICFVDSLEGNFDLITANPPYLTTEDMRSLQKEVEFEPSSALFGGEDGLLFYKEISRLYFSKLKVGGAIIFEIGSTQSEAVSKILKDVGYTRVSAFSDFGGNMRAVMAYRL